MARDPVCGMYVDEEHPAFTADVDGKTYYFCSEANSGSFDWFTSHNSTFKNLGYHKAS